MRFQVSDEGNTRTIEADSAREAAEEFAGTWDDWGSCERKTLWINVYVIELAEDGEPNEGTGEHVKVTLEPPEGQCDGALYGMHDWQEDGDPRGSGGGVVYSDTCAHCGLRRITNTWDYDPEDGRQGLTSVEYVERDEA